MASPPPPRIYYSILFSLSEPKQNAYIYCLMLQIRALRALGITDPYYLLTEDKTVPVLRQIPLIMGQCKIISMRTSPATCKEGMALKYTFPFIVAPHRETQITYLDLDMLPIAPLEIHVPQDTFVAYPEGSPTDANYCGDQPLALHAGVSGGFFAYTWGPRVKALFEGVLRTLKEGGTEFYTLDQPLLNHALVAHREAADFMPSEIVSFNGHGRHELTCFINCCGDPGDSGFHFRKMLEFFLSRP